VRSGAGRDLRDGVAATALLLLAACAATPDEAPGTTPAQHRLDPEQAAARFPIAVYDPWERFNRSVYIFNAEFDRYIYLPVVRAYEFVLPVFLQDRVSSFFSNLGEIRNSANGLLQGRPEVAGRGMIRFIVNSSFGVLGLFDVATRLGVFQQVEDFGQTLGRYGLGPGPYLVLPILGPSSLRDAGGFTVDTIATTSVAPLDLVHQEVYDGRPALYALEAVDRRHINGFRYYGTGSPFEYDLVRFLYTRSRAAEIVR
jgi:phospholipid-binding lipoprotein MlaA